MTLFNYQSIIKKQKTKEAQQALQSAVGVPLFCGLHALGFAVGSHSRFTHGHFTGRCRLGVLLHLF